MSRTASSQPQVLTFRAEAKSYTLVIGSGYLELTFERNWPAVWFRPVNCPIPFALPPDVLRALADEIERCHGL